ncbi:hypothetical protein [Cytobacillus sp. IB215316]|uniref:pPIWI_RE_Z domain-containing protein n=1 Tax=Cytobacillus sp. IB215316 TaxID=3097354 RepID=UPI002A15F900|nr:hypothetical protein [Cytobacillus sp. IB215316]MDX8359845.1 hypothetical protein [Cytobacillus sp. IB215316]
MSNRLSMFKYLYKRQEDFLKPLKEEWQQIDSQSLDKSDFNMLAEVELSCYAFEKNYPNIPLTASNVYSIFMGIDALIPQPIDFEQIQVLRIYFKKRSSKTTWQYKFNRYLLISTLFRAYEKSGSNDPKVIQLQRQIPSVLQQRFSLYDEILRFSHIMRDPIIPEFSDLYMPISFWRNYKDEKKGTFTTLSHNCLAHPGNSNRFATHWLEHGDDVLKSGSHLLIRGRKKQPHSTFSLSLEGETHWDEVAKDMDQKRLEIAASIGKNDSNTSYWQERQKSITLIPVNSTNQTFEYDTKVGIAGLVGAGKTTFIQLETFRLVQKGNKCGIVTINTTDTLKWVYDLYLVGIKAVPIVGKTNLDSHLQQFIRKVTRTSDGSKHILSELAMNYVLSFFGGVCIVDAFSKNADPTEPLKNYPCTSLITSKDKDKDKYLCPLYLTCGHFEAERQLTEADVWVGTSPAIQQSAPYLFLNPQQKTYYDLMNIYMDVIFVDEADGIQETFDSMYNNDNKLFGNHEQTFEKLRQKAFELFDQNQKIQNDGNILRFRRYLQLADRSKNLIFGLIQNKESVRHFLKKRTFSPQLLLSNVTRKWFDMQRDEDVMKNPLFQWFFDQERFNTEEYLDLVASQLDKIEAIKMDPNYDRKEVEKFEKEINVSRDFLMNYVLPNINGSIPKEPEEDDLVKFALYLYFYVFDTCFYEILQLKDYVEIRTNSNFDELINVIYQHIYKYLPFIPDALTMRRFQYYFKGNPSSQQFGTFEVYQYLGVGRSALTNWGDLYQYRDKQETCVVFLSGTSYAIGSTHYHVDVPISYVLKSKIKTLPKLEQFSHVFVNQDHKPIFISGSSENKKKARLQRLSQQIVSLIREELYYWELSEKDINKGRKVLVVVNSYEQSKWVYEALFPFFRDKVQALTQEPESDMMIRDEVIYSAEKDIDVLIVPLQSINRGYNILQKNSFYSYFGSVLFMVRPYLVTENVSNAISIINGYLPTLVEEATAQGKYFGDGISHVVKRANSTFEKLIANEEAFDTLDEEVRHIISWYTFVNVWQMIGRTLRGNTDARVHYVDAKFSFNRIKDVTEKNSNNLLEEWYKILTQHHDNIINQLYLPFIESVENSFSPKYHAYTPPY